MSVDEALIALIIVAMEANGHAAPAEAARAQRIVGSMARFRGRRGSLGRLIARMKRLAGEQPPASVLDAACRAIPPRLRGPALAVVADVVTVDGRLDRDERRFLAAVGKQLGQPRAQLNAIIDVIRMKNRT